MDVDKSEFRFGAMAVREGFVTPDQIIRALETQVKENLTDGSHRRLGEILMDLGFMESSQIDAVLGNVGISPDGALAQSC